MNRKTLLACAVLLALAISFSPVLGQVATSSSSSSASTTTTTTTSGSTTSSGAPAGSGVNITLLHDYAITRFGYGLINETFTFQTSGGSTAQIPTLQLTIPDPVASLTGKMAVTGSQFSLTQSRSGSGTVYTLAPKQASLAAGSSSSVSLKAFVKNVLNYSNPRDTTNATALVLVSPGLNMQVNTLRILLTVPQGGSFTPAPPGITSIPTTTSPSYSSQSSNATPKGSVLRLLFTDSDQGSFTPLTIPKLVRTITPSMNAVPMVQDRITLKNLASYDLTLLRLNLLNNNLTTVQMIPDAQPPLLNSQSVTLTGTILTFSETPLGGNLPAHSNVTFAISYPLPASAVSVSGSQISIAIPYAPPVAAVAEQYTLQLAQVKGINPVNATSMKLSDVSPLTPGTVDYSYSVNLGWAADGMIPAAFLIFGVAFVGLALHQKGRPPSEEEEEEGKMTASVPDLIQAFEEKFALENQRFEELRSRPRGSVGRKEFDQIREEFDALRNKAMQRLNEVKQDAGTGKQTDLLLQIGEAERTEDRASKDLLNLYSQHHGQRMNEETFQRLLPTYRKRVESAINRLSDLLSLAQKEVR